MLFTHSKKKLLDHPTTLTGHGKTVVSSYIFLGFVLNDFIQSQYSGACENSEEEIGILFLKQGLS